MFDTFRERVLTSVPDQDEALAYADNVASRLGRVAGDAVEEFEEWSHDGVDYLRNSLSSQPLLWCAAAAGIGVIVGLLAIPRPRIVSVPRARRAAKAAVRTVRRRAKG